MSYCDARLILLCRFPAQETISGASKIPTIIYYDKEGNIKAVGAEATSDGIYEAALEGDWYKAEWYVPYECWTGWLIVLSQVQAASEIQVWQWKAAAS
jgi:hypothetical protein